MASGTPSTQIRVPVGDLVYAPATNAHTILLGEILSGGVVKVIQQRKIYAAANNYLGRARVDQNLEKKIKKVSQGRKLPHSAKNTLFQILIHWQAFPYPYILPETVS